MYTVYKILNLNNGEFYIGVHKTDNPDDSYMGSGLRIKRSIAKYGKENFSKSILFLYDEKKLAYDKEFELLTECLSNPLCLNLSEGGLGGSNFAGKKHSDETKAKIAESLNGKIHTEERVLRNKNSHIGKLHTEEQKKKISDSLKGRKLSEETKKKISERLKQRFMPE